MTSQRRNLARRVAIGVLVVECALLLTTGFAKSEDIPGFSVLLERQGLVPVGLVIGAAWSVVLAEVLVAVCCLMLLLRRSPSKAAAVPPALLFSVFGAYALALVLLPPPVPTPCGCGIGLDTRQEADWALVAARNFCMAGVTMMCSLGLGGANAALGDRGTHLGASMSTHIE